MNKTKTSRTLKKVLKFIIIITLLIIVKILFIHRCDSQSGWLTGKQRSCDCAGFEWVLFDTLAGDGQKESYCVGFIKSSDCFEYKRNVGRIDCN